uniref:HTH_48 domain-containing protein n=1 Tax=Panagrellus redivivus TaxID=6233 RepID=A0A7E4UNE0_PANRE
MDRLRLRALIFHEHESGSTSTEATDNINRIYGEGTVTDRTVRNWFKRFNEGETRLEDLPRSGRPLAVDEEALRHELESNPQATTRELASTFNCSNSTIDEYLRRMGFRKVLAQWIPHVLTDRNLEDRVAICTELLERPHRKEFLKSIVTGDESWVFYDNTTRSAYWIPYDAPVPTHPKPDIHRRKVMLSVFWDSEGVLFWELLKPSRTINAEVYIAQIHKLAEAIKEKRRRRVDVCLLHDNARPHKAKVTTKFLEDLGWETVSHPPYSPDLAPSDYHLFRPLKHHLHGKKFDNLDDLETSIDNFFSSQPRSFWQEGIDALPKKWRVY